MRTPIHFFYNNLTKASSSFHTAVTGTTDDASTHPRACKKRPRPSSVTHSSHAPALLHPGPCRTQAGARTPPRHVPSASPPRRPRSGSEVGGFGGCAASGSAGCGEAGRPSAAGGRAAPGGGKVAGRAARPPPSEELSGAAPRLAPRPLGPVCAGHLGPGRRARRGEWGPRPGGGSTRALPGRAAPGGTGDGAAQPEVQRFVQPAQGGAKVGSVARSRLVSGGIPLRFVPQPCGGAEGAGWAGVGGRRGQRPGGAPG